VLNAKGGEIKAKKWISQRLVNFENKELEFGFCQNTLIAKFGLLWGRILIMGKERVFGT
jgi:hypothetical protein